MKTTIQILYDKGLFDEYNNAESFLKEFMFVTRRRADLEEVKDVHHLLPLNHKYKLKYKTTSNIKISEVISSLSLSDIGIYLRDGPFESDIGIVNLNPSKGSHWTAYTNEIFFASFGCVCPKKLSKFIIKTNWTMFIF